jgi:hypothetical protein
MVISIDCYIQGYKENHLGVRKIKHVTCSELKGVKVHLFVQKIVTTGLQNVSL